MDSAPCVGGRLAWGEAPMDLWVSWLSKLQPKHHKTIMQDTTHQDSVTGRALMLIISLPDSLSPRPYFMRPTGQLDDSVGMTRREGCVQY